MLQLTQILLIFCIYNKHTQRGKRIIKKKKKSGACGESQQSTWQLMLQLVRVAEHHVKCEINENYFIYVHIRKENKRYLFIYFKPKENKRFKINKTRRK